MTLEIYIHAAEALVARGEKATLKAVRQEAGGGSFSTITDALRIWRSRQTVTVGLENDSPLPADLTSTIESLWRQALTIAQSRVMTERAALAAMRRELEQMQNELVEAADGLAMQVDELNRRLGEEQTLRAQLEADLQAARAELDATEQLCRDKLTQWLGQSKKAA